MCDNKRFWTQEPLEFRIFFGEFGKFFKSFNRRDGSLSAAGAGRFSIVFCFFRILTFHISEGRRGKRGSSAVAAEPGCDERSHSASDLGHNSCSTYASPSRISE